MSDTFWNHQADLLQHALLHNLLKNTSHEDIAQLAGDGFNAGNTLSSVVAILKARLEEAKVQRQHLEILASGHPGGMVSVNQRQVKKAFNRLADHDRSGAGLR